MVTLDGRQLKTPRGQKLELKSERLVSMIAHEWQSKSYIVPVNIPLHESASIDRSWITITTALNQLVSETSSLIATIAFVERHQDVVTAEKLYEISYLEENYQMPDKYFQSISPPLAQLNCLHLEKKLGGYFKFSPFPSKYNNENFKPF
ncbi:hypothetical protein RF11_10434 [Thelohanellus kitauei]|uniref:ATP synthase mitochondrial F1 complex assembly factor 2 n=1 Tax=Thelohanellus kitauei TaxID=669202 RepID=A0A0C2N6A5_THEKT|nr:hypothetical protein RF11_10434 [Thelohanellus kitauei]